MSAAATLPAIATRPRRSEPRSASGRPAATLPSPGPTPPAVNPHHRGGGVLFEVPFTSSMTDRDLARLARLLDISTHMHPKMRPDPNSPGVARLDHHSGLFLERAAADDHWVLEARTWGHPSALTAHEWHLIAAQAAQQLDGRVTLPERLPTARPAVLDRPLGQAANKRLARIRRRLVGLP